MIVPTPQDTLREFDEAFHMPLVTLSGLCGVSEDTVLRWAEGGSVDAGKWVRAYQAMKKYMAIERTVKAMSNEAWDKILKGQAKGKKNAKAKG